MELPHVMGLKQVNLIVYFKNSKGKLEIILKRELSVGKKPMVVIAPVFKTGPAQLSEKERTSEFISLRLLERFKIEVDKNDIKKVAEDEFIVTYGVILPKSQGLMRLNYEDYFIFLGSEEFQELVPISEESSEEEKASILPNGFGISELEYKIIMTGFKLFNYDHVAK